MTLARIALSAAGDESDVAAGASSSASTCTAEFLAAAVRMRSSERRIRSATV